MIPLIDLTLNSSLSKKIKVEVNKVIDSKSYILGKQLQNLEKKFAKFCGVKESVGVANGTDALSLSLRSLGIGQNDKVLTVAFTSPFTSIAIIEEGAIPVYCDIDEKTWTIDLNDCAKKITKNVKAIMPVHIYGNPCNMDDLVKFAKEYNLFLIEDACQAHNASFGNKKVGNFGEAAGFSFYPTKNIGGLGDGGILTTNNKQIAKLAKILRHGGQTKRFWHEFRGKNSRLDEIQAVILSLKLDLIEKNHIIREKLMDRYKRGLVGLPIRFQENFQKARSAYHLCVIRVSKQKSLKDYLYSRGIESGIYYPYPLYKQPTFSKYNKLKLPVTEQLSKELLAIPITPSLTINQQDYIIDTIRKFYRK